MRPCLSRDSTAAGIADFTRRREAIPTGKPVVHENYVRLQDGSGVDYRFLCRDRATDTVAKPVKVLDERPRHQHFIFRDQNLAAG